MKSHPRQGNPLARWGTIPLYLNRSPVMKKQLILSLFVVCSLPAAAGEPVASGGPKLASGLLMKQEGKLVFAPCRDRSYALVDDVSSGGALTAALDGIGLGAGKKLYVEMWGSLEGAVLKASVLNFARADGRCQPTGGPDETWRATGSDPAPWTLAAGGEHLVFKRSGRPEQRLAFKGSQDEAAVSTYRTPPGETPAASWRFDRKICRDKGSDVVFGWTATVTVAGEKYQGCAWQR